MSAEEILRANERSATKDLTPSMNYTGGKERDFAQKIYHSAKKRKSLGATGIVTGILLILILLFSSGNLIPAAILERLIEATDVQYADAMESKFLVFQQALSSGEVPTNTVERLKENGIEIEGGTLIYNEERIPAENFINKIHSDAGFYNAFNLATYDRAAYYYDEAAEAVFKKIGTTRNNYTESSDFTEVMEGLVGEGSNINVSNVGLTKKTNEQGETVTEYEKVGEEAKSGEDTAEFIATVAKNNLSADQFTATMNATDALNTADTISKEQKSSIFFMGIMENISKMKAGLGNSSKINEMMNLLYDERETSILNTKTGEMVTSTGSMLEAPSLYAILAGTKINAGEVENYASDRVLKTVENRVGIEIVDSKVKEGTVTSTNTKNKGTIGRLLEAEEAEADEATLSVLTPTINSSLIQNGFSTIGGIYGGEMLVEGAVNVGKELAKASGGAVGDAAAVQAYTKTTETILALDAEADRMNRSPFDISSPNTFLGAAVYKLGVSVYKNSINGSAGEHLNILRTIGGALRGAFNNVYAEDAGTNYLTNFGNCETIRSLGYGAVGSATCSEIATFDTSTLNNTFSDPGFTAFVKENTELEDGVRTIKKNSQLANYIKYNDERITPVGVMDGGILEAVQSGASKIPFVSNIISLIKAFIGADEEEKAMATGKAFVNSSTNPEWETYKYAQRYVSLARATSVLKQYDGEETAYNNLLYFEGEESPVTAFLRDYYNEIGIK